MKSTFLISFISLVIFSFADINQASEEKIEFGYTGLTGPAFWHTLSESSAICDTGKKQSPIDITPEDLKEFADAPEPNFKDAKNVESFNNGNTVEIFSGDEEVPLPADITIDGEKYELLQFHFHTPSEHRVNGKHHDIEQHMVFLSESGKVSVVAVFYDVGSKESEFMAPIVAKLPKNKDDKEEIEEVKLSCLLKDVNGIKEAFTYSGSLTTPPCTEGVTWYVNQEAQEVSLDQFVALRDVIGFNSRFTQLRPDDKEVPEEEEEPKPIEVPVNNNSTSNSYKSKKRSLYSHSYFNKF